MTTGAHRRARTHVFSRILRRLRALRDMTRQATAQGMGLEIRSFDRFESGEVRLDLERIFDFAAATESDPLAIVASLYLKNPELAARCADNKLMVVQAMSLERLHERLGERLTKLDPATWMDIQDRLIDELVREIEAREARAREWLAGSPRDPEPTD